MATNTLVRDSVVVFAMVVLSAYAAGLVLEVVFGGAETSQTGRNMIFAGGLFLVIAGLGFLLWRSAKYEG